MHTIENNSPFIQEIRNYEKNGEKYYLENLTRYFYLSLCAHWATCGSFCPTDVDNNIRLNLWRRKETPEHLEEMWQLTIDSLHWNYEGVSNKIIYHPDNPDYRLSYHEGTWFSVAVGAYAAALKYKNESWRKKIYEAIAWEMKKEQEIAEYWYKNDAFTFVKLSALISHNLGDFDRVVDMWQINPSDELVQNFYHLSQKPNTLFHFLCEYYKKYLSIDNHRNFAYRTPKSLRKHESLLLPIGPFHEEWGGHIAQSKLLSEGEKMEIIIAMASGFEKLPGDTYGYARAYHGFKNNFAALKYLLSQMTKKDLRLFESSNFVRKSNIPTKDFHQTYIHAMHEMSKDFL